MAYSVDGRPHERTIPWDAPPRLTPEQLNGLVGRELDLYVDPEDERVVEYRRGPLDVSTAFWLIASGALALGLLVLFRSGRREKERPRRFDVALEVAAGAAMVEGVALAVLGPLDALNGPAGRALSAGLAVAAGVVAAAVRRRRS